MKRKFTLIILGIAVAACMAFAFSACGLFGTTEKDKNKVNGILLSDGTKQSVNLSYTYTYGEKLAFLDSFKIYLDKSGGKEELTGESLSECVLTYKLADDTEKHEISADTVLDVGTYNLEYRYKSEYFAYVDITIERAEAEIEDFTFSLTDGNNQPVADKKIKFGTLTFKSNVPVSPYKLSIGTQDKTLKREQIKDICLLSVSEYKAYSALTTREDRQNYLKNHEWVSSGDSEFESRSITRGMNGPDDEKTYVGVNSSAFIPADYYVFAHVKASDNYNEYFTQPNSKCKITIEKGEFSFKNAVYDEQEKLSKDEIWTMLDLHAEYTYGYNHESEAYQFGDVALSTLDELNTITYNSDSDFINRMNISLFGAGSGAFTYGKFVYASPAQKVNSATGNNGVTTVNAKFVLNEDYGKFFESEETYPITLTVKKGVVQKPCTPVEAMTQIPYDFGEELSFDVTYDDDVIKLAGQTDTLKASAVGTYKAKFELIDPANYTYNTVTDDDYYYGEDGEFEWAIIKRDVNSAAYTTTLTYADAVCDSVQYDRQHKTFSFAVDFSSSETEYKYFVDRTFDWRIEVNANSNVKASLQNARAKFSNTVTLASISESDYVDIVLNAAADENFEEFEMSFSVYVLPSELTTDEKRQLYSVSSSELFAEAEADGTLFLAKTFTVYKNTTGESTYEYYIKKEEVPQTALTELGSWHLYYWYCDYESDIDITKEVQFAPSSDVCKIELEGVTLTDADIENIKYYYVFEPNDRCINGVLITVDTVTEYMFSIVEENL